MRAEVESLRATQDEEPCMTLEERVAAWSAITAERNGLRADYAAAKEEIARMTADIELLRAKAADGRWDLRP